MQPEAAERARKGKAAAPTVRPSSEDTPAYRVAQTRAHTRQISAHYAADTVQAFRVLAAELDMDVQELLAEAINMTFERHGKPDRIDIVSGRRKRRAA
jgi:hypothetical protein